jgi:hypothetical protein
MHDSEIVLKVLRLEAGHVSAHVVFIKILIFGQLSSEETTADRAGQDVKLALIACDDMNSRISDYSNTELLGSGDDCGR